MSITTTWAVAIVALVWYVILEFEEFEDLDSLKVVLRGDNSSIIPQQIGVLLNRNSLWFWNLCKRGCGGVLKMDVRLVGQI